MVFPIIVLPMIPLLGGSEKWNQIAVIFFVAFFGLLTFIAVLPTGAENPGCFQTFVRYLFFVVFFNKSPLGRQSS